MSVWLFSAAVHIDFARSKEAVGLPWSDAVFDFLNNEPEVQCEKMPLPEFEKIRQCVGASSALDARSEAEKTSVDTSFQLFPWLLPMTLVVECEKIPRGEREKFGCNASLILNDHIDLETLFSIRSTLLERMEQLEISESKVAKLEAMLPDEAARNEYEYLLEKVAQNRNAREKASLLNSYVNSAIYSEFTLHGSDNIVGFGVLKAQTSLFAGPNGKDAELAVIPANTLVITLGNPTQDKQYIYTKAASFGYVSSNITEIVR